MAKKKADNEQDDINRERLIDIVLIIEHMEALQIDKEFFTDEGIGFLKGLASVKDEIKFVSKAKYDKLAENDTNLISDLTDRIKEIKDENIKLKQTIDNLRKPKKRRFW